MSNEPINLDEAKAAWEYWAAGNGGEKVALDEGVTHLVPALFDHVRDLEAKLAKARELHEASYGCSYSTGKYELYCKHCNTAWPCATASAIDFDV